MKAHFGRAIAVGLLCAVAATVGLWSGPLESASASLHAGVPAHSTPTNSTSAHR